MKRILTGLVVLSTGLSCMLFRGPILGEVQFPLSERIITPIEGGIREIAVAETWVAVDTLDKITAIDINTQKVLWNIDFPVITYGQGLLTIDDTLIAASTNRIILINRDGHQREVSLRPEQGSITHLVAVYKNYLYVVRDPKWTFEAYDLSRNTLLWKTVVGRGGGDAAFYDSSSNIVYVTGGSIQAFDNTTGALSWNKAANSLTSVYEAGVLYDYEESDRSNHYRVVALDVENQQELWSHDFIFLPAEEINNITVIGDMLILCAEDLIALDKSSGQQVWRAAVGEAFYQCPVEFNNLLYAKTGASRTVYAISAGNGALIGLARLETPGILSGADATGSVYLLKNGIIFNTMNSVVVYRSR